MPAPPAVRISPGRELRASNHRRGRSFDGGLLLKEKDDDLALFNEMHVREKEDFLLQSTDGFEDAFSIKLKHFSDLKLGISIPARGETSALLNVDGGKNDYDWLLTPPDTPLFPSLDDEPSVTVSSRGRPRSQPISISRSSTTERSHRSSRGSASPNRLSPSPRSTNSVPQSRGRTFSAPHSSPTLNLQRPSSPPSKPETPAPRSITPTPRRLSTGSRNTITTTGTRGTSPVKTARGNSASPKIRAWQTNIPGFSSDVPPNLRVSLADRPASYVRGSSPASRISRQSTSPTASRSVGSSHSHDRDRFSSYSRGSVASSGDDDVDSLQSIPMAGLDHSSAKRVGAFSINKATASSKRPVRIVPSSSAPKRSLESTARQMDQHKTPQNMFRPLLSSVPSTTFYAGKTNSSYRSLISRNSSVTTSSNASSDLGMSIAPDTERSDHNQDDIVSESEKVPYSDIYEDVFDKMDVVNEDLGPIIHNKSPDIQHGDIDRDGLASSKDIIRLGISPESATSEASDVKRHDIPEVVDLENIVLCSRCGCHYHAIDLVEKDAKLCPECFKEVQFLGITITDKMNVSPESSTLLTSNIAKAEDIPFDKLEPPMVVLELPPIMNMGEPMVSPVEEDVDQDHSHLEEQSPLKSLEEEDGPSIATDLETCPPAQLTQTVVGHTLPGNDSEDHHSLPKNDYQNLRGDISEGAGISILLKGSSSIKGPVVQGRTFTATSIHYDNLSYARDSQSSFRSSIGHNSSFSASSSTDFSSARQIETRVQWQLSGRKSDMENYRHEVMNFKPQSTSTSSSGISQQILGLATSTQEATLIASEYVESDVMEDNKFEGNTCSKTMETSAVELLRNEASIHAHGNSAMSHYNEDCAESGEEVSSDMSVSDIEEEHRMVEIGVSVQDDKEVGPHSSATVSEIETDKKSETLTDSRNEDVSMISKDKQEDVHESFVPPSLDGDLSAVPDIDSPDGILAGQSTVVVDCQGGGGNKARSLTLEEATDAILFCSSIVHDIAYSAATIAMEKETRVPPESSRPTLTVLGKSNTDRKDLLRNRTAGKHRFKSQKPRQRRTSETDVTKSVSVKTENDENNDDSAIRNVGISNKVDGMKQPPPPKLESKCNCSIM